jgi:hypothetical protein
MNPETPPLAAAVVCHAHPLQGGVMHFKVIFRAAKALQERGLATLRFNFRGVGLSEGVHDDGRGEQDDVIAALDEAERRFPGLPLVLGGFSFGSAMALRVAARDPRPRAVFALGLPLTKLSDTDYIRKIRVPRLFIQGEGDVFGNGAALRTFTSTLTGPHELRVIAESDHFFTGRLEQMQSQLSTWLASEPWNASFNPRECGGAPGGS